MFRHAFAASLIIASGSFLMLSPAAAQSTLCSDLSTLIAMKDWQGLSTQPFKKNQLFYAQGCSAVYSCSVSRLRSWDKRVERKKTMFYECNLPASLRKHKSEMAAMETFHKVLRLCLIGWKEERHETLGPGTFMLEFTKGSDNVQVWINTDDDDDTKPDAEVENIKIIRNDN